MKKVSNNVSMNSRTSGIIAIAAFLTLFASTFGVGWMSFGAVAGTSNLELMGDPGPEPTGDPGSGWIPDQMVDVAGAPTRNPQIATGPGGELHAVYQVDAAVGGWQIIHQESTDGGLTWSPPSGVAATADDETNPDIAIHPGDGRIFVAYERWTSLTDTAVWISYSDDGLTWTNVLVFDFVTWPDIDPSVVVDHDNFAGYDVWVAWTFVFTPDNRNVMVYRSTDRGATWAQQLGLGQPAGDVDVYDFPEIVFQHGSDAVDRLLLVCRNGNDFIDTDTILLVWSDDFGATWSAPFVVAAEASNVGYPTIAASKSQGDSFMVAWQLNAADQSIRYRAKDGTTDASPVGAGWDPGPGTRFPTGGNGMPDWAPRLAVDGDHVVNNNLPMGDYHMVWTTNSNEVWYTERPTDLNAGFWSASILVIDTAGQASVNYPSKGITTQLRGTDWYPGVVWNDFRGVGPYNIAYTTPGSRVVVDSNPVGRDVEVDTLPYVAPANFVWPAGLSHLINAPSPQAGALGTRYVWNDWSDLGLQSHTVVAGTVDITYTANFITQYEVTIATAPDPNLLVDVDTVSLPAPRVFWWDDGSVHDIDTFTPQPGAIPQERYVWNSWSDGGPQAHQITVTMPDTITANFGLQHEVTIYSWDQTNAAPLPNVPVYIDGPQVGTTAHVAWLNDGQTYDIGVQDPFNDGVNDYNFVDWDFGPNTNPVTVAISGWGSMTARYDQAPSSTFSLEIAPLTITIAPGDIATYTITLTSLSGYAGDVQLSASALPGGLLPPATAAFLPNPATVPLGGQVTSTLTIDNTAAVPDNTYTITVDGQDTLSAAISDSNDTELIVATPSFDVTALPLTQPISPGQPADYTVTVSSVNGYAGSVALTAAALPAGLLPPATATFVPSTVVVPAFGSGTSTLTISNTGTVVDNTYGIRITGDDTVDTDTFDVELVVTTIPFFTIDATPALLSVTPGGIATYTVTVTSVNTYAGNVDVSVGHTLVAADASMSWDKILLVIPDGGSDSAVLTVDTTAAIALMDFDLDFYADEGGLLNVTDQSTLNITAVVTGSISGTVRDQDNDEVDDAMVELLEGTILVASTSTNSDGDYSFANVDAGSYTVKATKTGYDDDTITVTVTAADPDQTDKDLILELTTYKIEGDVKDKDTGEGIGGATVKILDENGAEVGSDITSGSGHFSVGDLPPGDYTIVITADDYKELTLEDEIVDQDLDLRDVDITPKAAAGDFLSDYWWLLLLIIIIVIVIILVALLAKRKKPEPEPAPEYATAQVPAEQAPPYEAPQEQPPYEPPQEQYPQEPQPETYPEEPQPETPPGEPYPEE